MMHDVMPICRFCTEVSTEFVSGLGYVCNSHFHGNPAQATIDGKLTNLCDIALPKGGTGAVKPLARNHFLEVVGKCPNCGAPVYGHKAISVKDEKPEVRYVCECRNKAGRIQSVME